MQEFILKEGIWLGEGTIALSSSTEQMKFYTKWEIAPESRGQIEATQTIQLQGENQVSRNFFFFTAITETTFTLTIKNEQVEAVQALGSRRPRQVSWNYTAGSTLEGKESYTHLQNQQLLLKAEYGSGQYQTMIEGKLWKKLES